MVKVEWELGRRDQWMYRLFGPTTLHLQHEFYLLLSLLLLTVSSLQSVYYKSFGIWGDYKFLFWSTLWLSRHLVTRWLCTWDNSTNRRPSLLGVVGHWMTSHILAGQYFDRPTPQVVSKTVGTPLADDGRVVPTVSSFLLPSILYTWQLVKVRMWYPLLQLYEIAVRVLYHGGSGGGGSSSSNNSEAGSDVSSTPVTSSRRGGERGGATNNQHRHPHPYLTTAYGYWTKGWALYGPPLQLTIPVCVMTFYIWHLFFATSAPTVTTHALTMSTRNGQSQDPSHFENKPFGAYKKMEIPDWTQVLFYLSCGGTLASILLYGRLILPIPDLVAGSNVLKAVRNEAKLLGNQSGTGKSAKAKLLKEVNDMPWAEQYKSIVGENRFRMICKIAFVRTMEALFVCALFPRTGFSCRATGHCSQGVSWSELSKIIYPAGIAEALRSDGSYQNQFALTVPDRGAAIMVILSVVHIMGALLLVQCVTLSRSYLGIMGFIAGEWTQLEESDPSIGAVAPSQWDPRRRYKKGDLIVQSYPAFGGQSIYRATSNSPEGRPFDFFLRATHDLFRNELGQPVTSYLVALSVNTQIGFTALVALIVLWYQIMNYPCGGLLWTLAANIVATYGLSSVGLPHQNEIATLAREINQNH